MKLLLTGASGFLGREVFPRLAADYEVIGLAHRAPSDGRFRCVDLRAADALRALLADVRPDVVVHAAAYRDPDFCEAQPEETARLNVEPVRVLCAALPSAARLVFIGTDYVFDGEHPPYREDSPRRPLSEYGRSKAAAEDVVTARPGSLILRIPLLVGAGPTPAESGFIAQLFQGLENRNPQAADDTLIRYPTWTRDVAEALAFVLRRGQTGVLHYSGAEPFTRYGAFQAAARATGMSAAHIRPAEGIVPRGAVRPRNSRLATDRIRALGFARFTPFDEVLRVTAAELGRRAAGHPPGG